MRWDHELGAKLAALLNENETGRLKDWKEYNKLSSIVFATPEIGKWSTVGGLG